MTTYQVPPSFNAPLTYNVQLDSQSYTLTIFYLFYGQRLYFTLTDLIGNLIVTRPLIASNGDIDNLFGYFTTSKMYYSSSDEIVAVV